MRRERIVRTGVYCKKGDLDMIKNMIQEKVKKPLLILPKRMTEESKIQIKLKTHEIALQHGLPEFGGFYGLTADGEFVKAEPVESGNGRH